MTPFNLPTNVIPQKEYKLNAKTFPKENDIILSTNGQMKLSKKISEGGEGIIYAVNGNSSIVCKIYHPEKLTNLRKEKIELMISKKISFEGICWPIDLIYNNLNEFVGYIMPAANGKTMQTSMFIKPALLRNFPNFTRKDLVNISISFLEKMKFLHSMNIIVGDINALNILVETNGKIWFVDTDSYQIENFPCPVGTVNFTAPEIQGKDYATFMRTKNHELFAVATMLFMILFPGKPPYAQQGGESQADNIKKMNFPYWCDEKAEVNPPEGSWNFIWSNLTRKVKENFCLTFSKNQRRTLDEWISVLSGYKWSIEKGYNTDELFPQGFPVKDPVEVHCSKCNTKHINSQKSIDKMKSMGKGVFCNSCHREFKLKNLARKSHESKVVTINSVKNSSSNMRTNNRTGGSGGLYYGNNKTSTSNKYNHGSNNYRSNTQSKSPQKSNFVILGIILIVIGGLLWKISAFFAIALIVAGFWALLS